MSNQHRRPIRPLVAAIVIVATACAGEPPSRSGQPVEPVALSAVVADPGGVGGDVLGRLTELSVDAAVRVAPSTPGVNGTADEGELIQALRDGKADVAVVRADQLVAAGATSLAVLQVPMLVTSVEQADRIAADPVAADLMSGLDSIGLVGLALVPGGLRHPFGYRSPLLVPADYRGQVFNTRPGAGVDALFAALGASTDNSLDEQRAENARTGAVRGIEVSLQQQRAADLPAVVTSNVVLYTKFDVVVVRAAIWDSLSGAQRDALRAQAVAAGAKAISERDTESEALERWCSTDGASSVMATPDQIAALRDALQPVVDGVSADPQSADLVRRVAALGEGTVPPAGTTCGAPDVPSQNESYQVEPKGPQDVLEGTWRLTVDREHMLDEGVSAQDANANAGIWTLEIVGNVATVDQPNGGDCTWEFSFAENAVSLDMGARGNDACYGRAIGTYELEGDAVQFHFDRDQDYDVVLDNAFFDSGMQRIG